MDNGSLNYRYERVDRMVQCLGGKKEHDLMASFSIPVDMLEDFELAIMLFVSKALGSVFSSKKAFLELINSDDIELENVTPNGRVMPKKEYQLEYNLVLRGWHKIFALLHARDKSVIHRVKFYPSIRIKLKEELAGNAGRPFRTSLPHSDAWVDGFWGLNIHMPLIGDTRNNRLRFYVLDDPASFRPEMLEEEKSFEEMQWVLKYYRVDNDIITRPGSLYVSDYSLIHESFLWSDDAMARVSIDSGLIVGEHCSKDDHLDFVAEVPPFGLEDFCVCVLSTHGEFFNKVGVGGHDATCFVKNLTT